MGTIVIDYEKKERLEKETGASKGELNWVNQDAQRRLKENSVRWSLVSLGSTIRLTNISTRLPGPSTSSRSPMPTSRRSTERPPCVRRRRSRRVRRLCRRRTRKWRP